MKVGDLVKVIRNDMSLVIKKPGMKDNRFFDQVGVILDVCHLEPCRCHFETGMKYWVVQFPAGIYEAQTIAIEVIND